MLPLKTRLRQIAFRFGVDVRLVPKSRVGRSPFDDIALLCPDASVVMDVGANVGQSVIALRSRFPAARIIAFEPDRRALARLEPVCAKVGATVEPIAVGASDGEVVFYEYWQSEMSSVLPPGADGWSRPKSSRSVASVTLDTYCRNNGIGAIDVLKIDVQGADGSVLKGASDLLKRRAIGFIRSELTFSNLYSGADDPLSLLGLARSHGYQIVSFYELNYRNNRLGWADVVLAK